MKRCSNVSVLMSFFLCSLTWNANAVIRGSESAVSVQSYFEFPVIDILFDNVMLGFSWFKNGFGLADSSTTCTFDAVYPVSGPINMNGGSLFLKQDLCFNNVTTFNSWGSFWANNKKVELPSSVTTIPSDTGILSNVSLVINNDVLMTGTITVKGNCSIVGNRNSFALGANASLVIDKGATLELRDVEFEGVKNGSISLVDDTSRLVLHNVQWVQDNHYNFTRGSIQIIDKVEFVGDYAFVYDSYQSSTIEENSQWILRDGLTLTIGRKKATNYVEPLIFMQDTSVLKFDNASLVITSTGIGFTTGTLLFDREGSLDILGSTTSTGMMLGDGVAAHDFMVQFASGSALAFNQGYLVYNNVVPDNVKAEAHSSTILRYENSKVFVAQNWILPAFTVRVIANSVPVTTLASGKTIGYNATRQIYAQTDFEVTGNQATGAIWELNGNDSMFFTKGYFPLPLQISGLHNQIRGSADIRNVMTLQDSSSELIVDLNGSIDVSMNMNNGTLTLAGDCYLGRDAVLSGSSTVNLDVYQFHFGAQEFVWTGTTLWSGSNAGMHIHSTSDLRGTWTIDGTCSLNGNGNILDLASVGQIVVMPNSSLLLKDINLHGVSQSNIRCVDDSAKIIFDNTSVVFDANTTFSVGSLEFINSVNFIGDIVFFYDSSQTSTIDSNSSWNIGAGMALKIGRKSSSHYVEPLAFTDQSSTLLCNASTLLISDYGAQFTKGTLTFDGKSTLDITGTVTERGLIMGDGTLAHDAVMLFNSGASMDFVRGYYVYNNYSADGLKAMSKTASVTRYGDSKVYVTRDWTLPPWTLRVAPGGAPLTVLAPGASFGYNNTNLVFPQAEMDLSAHQRDSVTFLLDGNDYMYFSKGVFPLPIIVDNAGNELRGNGDIAGTMVLTNSAAEIIFDLQGKIVTNVALNGGVVSLSDDLRLSDGAVLTGTGTINLDTNTIDFGSKDSVWTGTLLWSGNSATIALHAGVDLSSTWSFNGVCIINGNGNVLNLGDSGRFIITPDSTLVLRDVYLKNVSGDPISCVDDSGRVVFANTYWQQDGNVAFQRGSMTFIGEVEFVGSYTFSYESSQTSTIASNSEWAIKEGMTLKIGRSAATNAVEPLIFSDKTSVLRCDTSTVHIDQYGGMFTKGKLIFDGESVLDIASTTTEYGMIMGNGISADDFTLFLSSGASMNFVKGCYVYNNYGSHGLQVDSKTAGILRYADSIAYVAHNWTLPPFTLRVAPGGAPTTNLAPGVIFGYNNTNLVFPTSEMDLTAHQSDSVTFILSGDNYIYLTKGDYGLPLIISGSNNEIRGNGNVVGPVVLADQNASLAFNLQGNIITNVQMNGGTITLMGDVSLANGVVFEGTGSVDLQSNTIDLGSKDSVWTSTLLWQADNATIQLNAETELLGTWTVSGICIINGNGNTLDFGTVGHIVVAHNSKLIIRNAYVKNIAESSITCADDSASLVFDNISCIQGTDVIFDRGSIQFLNQVDLLGSYTFYYESSQTSTISAKSMVIVKDGATLSVGRSTSINYVEPLMLEDATSVLQFDNANLSVTSNGWRITNGSMIFNRDVGVDVASTSTVNGLEFGDGITLHDPVLQVSPGSVLRFASGHFIYNITNSMNLKSNSNTARLSRDASTVLYVKQSLDLPEITIKASPLAQLVVAPGKTLSYNNCIITTNQVEFNVVGSRYSAVASLLSDNGLIFITRGSLPLATLVSGVGNRVVGNGGISGGISLLSSAAALNVGVEGAVTGNIALGGGSIILERDLYLANGAVLTGQGAVNLGLYGMTIASQDSSWTSTVGFNSSNAAIQLNGAVDLSGTWTISGSCVINGQGNVLSLEHGTIVVAADSSVVFRNIRLKGVHGNNIECLNDNASITLDNVTWLQDGDYALAQGAMLFKNHTKFSGPYVFAYSTARTSTITADASVCFDNGMTFSYDPAIPAVDLVHLENDSSELRLAHATLHVTVTGMQLVNGAFTVLNDSTVYTETETYLDQDNNEAVVDNGLTLGDGLSSAHDIQVNIRSGVILTLERGSIHYKNVLLDALSMTNESSRLYIGSGSTLYMHHDMSLGLGVIGFYENSTLARSVGVQILGSTYMFGQLHYVTI